eukprot:CAMPEP_0171760778 /NCGR_PEP_ID=MMETSP0991-20121206/47668_1 /TAXON_ID=483369 /ORGANISM="non described non described, Strain CCMP2098" /LENGTH=234 /DNA_ID=CAMNT_0012363925 /DNA_START=8 /DNA_END=712 /DNA_ORIENTATION=-
MAEAKVKTTTAKGKAPKAATQKKSAAEEGEPKTLLDKVVVAIRAHRAYNGTSRQVIAKYVETEFGNNSKPALAAALKKGVATGVLAQQRQSFTVVGDPDEKPPPEEEVDSDSDEKLDIPPSFEKSAHAELIVEDGGKKHRVPVSRSQWAEWLADPNCEDAEYGLSEDKDIDLDSKHDGCWTHDLWGGGYFGHEGNNGDHGDLADCMDCPDCYLGEKMFKYINKGIEKKTWEIIT